MDNKTVGELIKESREKANLSKNQLGELAKVSHTEISRIESGEREVPNPKTLRKISKFIGVNYNDLMYASGLGAQVSPLNPYLIEYYDGLKGEELKNNINTIKGTINSNNVIIDSLKTSLESANEEKKNVLLDTIEDLEYQNTTNTEILKLLESNALKEFMGNRNE